MHNYFVIYKPFGVLSQFTSEGKNPGLGTLYNFPKDCYPVGRLDTDSEGLLLITNDTNINHKLLHPSKKHQRTYYVQVEGDITDAALEQLRSGTDININGIQFRTSPCTAEKIAEPALPERNPPIRFRANIPTSWIKLTISEGKNRQVRRMTAKVGFPTLRLVRWAIENLTIQDMQPGDFKELERNSLIKLLKL